MHDVMGWDPDDARDRIELAHVVHGVDFAVHISDADHFVAAGKFRDFVGSGQIGIPMPGAPDENHFTSAAKSDGCTIAYAFQVKKAIPT